MTNEEKQLLLKDLCARFPYNIKVRGVFLNYNKDKDKILYEECDRVLTFDELRHNPSLKPYLRPMSSMTVDEYNEFSDVANMTIYEDGKIITNGRDIDWLCKHHFDFRDLIGIGLALEAPEGMYNTKTDFGKYIK